MKERPILFTGQMVRAVLEGRKTQTRRVLMPQPPANVTGTGRYGASSAPGYWMDKWSWLSGDLTDIDACDFEGDFSTGFLEGDHLWVREAWRADSQLDGIPPRQMGPFEPVYYEADGALREPTCIMISPGRYRHGRFMPRALSRLTLPVTDVRVQRLQDISEEDAQAEGVWRFAGRHWKASDNTSGATPVAAFAVLWNSINGKKPGRSWEDNPWVVAVRFEQLELRPS